MVTKKQSVADAIEEQIESGDLGRGDKLPTERDLAAKHGVSREAVRAAMQILADAGQIESRQGSGWYVRNLRRLRFPLHTIDAGRAKATADIWDTFVEGQGRTGGSALTVDPAAVPPERIRRKLRLGPDDLVVRRHRIRFVDDEKWMISIGWWPRWLAKGTAIEGNENRSLLTLAIELGHGQVASENEVSARMPTAEEANTLSTGRGVPVMEMLTTGWDAAGKPIRVTEDVFPAHRFILVFEHDWSTK